MTEYHPVTGEKMIEIAQQTFLTDPRSDLDRVIRNMDAFVITSLRGSAFLLSDIQVREDNQKGVVPLHIDCISGKPYEILSTTEFLANASHFLEQVMLRRTSYVLMQYGEEVAHLLFDFLEETGRYNKRGQAVLRRRVVRHEQYPEADAFLKINFEMAG